MLSRTSGNWSRENFLQFHNRNVSGVTRFPVLNFPTFEFRGLPALAIKRILQNLLIYRFRN